MNNSKQSIYYKYIADVKGVICECCEEVPAIMVLLDNNLKINFYCAQCGDSYSKCTDCNKWLSVEDYQNSDYYNQGYMYNDPVCYDCDKEGLHEGRYCKTWQEEAKDDYFSSGNLI